MWLQVQCSRVAGVVHVEVSAASRAEVSAKDVRNRIKSQLHRQVGIACGR